MGRKLKRLKQENNGVSPRFHTAPGEPLESRESHAFVGLFSEMDRSDKLSLGLLMLFILSVYWYTMWPTVAGGDSGELIAAAHTLGVVHPPGYPLFTMIGKLFSLVIPFGTVGWRINLVSAVFSLSSSLFLYLSLFKLTKNSAASVFTVGLFALSPLVWRYSILAEVFTLNNFFVTLLLYLFIRYQDERAPKLVYLMGLIFGLGLTNHHTLVFVGVPMGLYILAQKDSGFLRPANFLALFLVSIAGLIPYTYLYFSSLQTPLVAWGDITSVDGFLKHFLRKEYGTFKLATEGTDKSQLFQGLWYFVQSLGVQALYIGSVFIATGLYLLTKAKQQPYAKPYLWLFLAMPTGYLVFFHTLANLPFVDGASLYKDIVSRFWIMPGLFFFIFAAVGYNYWCEKLTTAQNRGESLDAGSRLNNARTLVPMVLAIILILTQFAVNFEKENAHGNYSFQEFGRNLLKPLPQNALFFTLGDINTNTVRYVQQCEGYRTDVKVLDRSLMSYPWLKRIGSKHFPDVTLPGKFYHPLHPVGYNLKKLFDANVGLHQVYVTFIKQKGALESTDKSFQDHYRLVPYGLSFLVEHRDKPFEVERYLSSTKSYLINPDEAFPDPPPPASWEEVIYNNYWLAHHLRAVEVLKFAMAENFDPKYLDLSRKLLQDLVDRRSSPPADYYKNLGISHHHLERQSQAPQREIHRAEMLKNWRHYLKSSQAPESPTYQKIMAIVSAYDRAGFANRAPADVEK